MVAFFCPPPFMGGKTPFEIVFASSDQNPANSSSYSWPSAFTAQPGDLVVVAAAGRASSSSNVSSISIGGSAGTLVVTGGNGLSPAAMWQRIIQPGDTDAIQVNFSGAQGRAGYCCIVIRGYASSAAFDSGVAGVGGNQSSLSSSLDIPVGGGGFFFVTHNNTSATSWANADRLSDDVSESATAFSGAMQLVPAGATDYVATASWSGSTASVLVYASWG